MDNAGDELEAQEHEHHQDRDVVEVAEPCERPVTLDATRLYLEDADSPRRPAGSFTPGMSKCDMGAARSAVELGV